MNIYIELLLVACLATWLVDCSGAADTLLALASKFTRNFGYGPVTSLRPFTCDLCATWWATIIYALCMGQLSLPVICYCAALAHFSFTLARFFIFLNEAASKLVGFLLDLCNRD